MALKPYQKDFIEFCIDSKVLSFGDFTLKSGRTSPYFFNAGLFNTGGKLQKLGGYYAAALQDSGLEYDVLFGPAYKGIPLVSSLAVSLAGNEYSKDVPYAFNRKEAKDHGEGGVIVGSALEGRVLVVDDVITAGTAIREAVEIIKKHGKRETTLSGVLIALDREERGKDTALSAIQQVEKEYEIRVVRIVTLSDILQWLEERAQIGNQDSSSYVTAVASIRKYRSEWGLE